MYWTMLSTVSTRKTEKNTRSYYNTYQHLRYMLWNFNRFLTEDCNATLQSRIIEVLIDYCSMFHKTFSNIENTSIDVSDGELHR